MSLAPGTRIGPYEVSEPLGAGGMGEVYRAIDIHLGRAAAIKVLPDAFARDAERVARFEREARTLASLNHPHIAQVFGLEKGPAEAGHHNLALAMELVEGPTLADRIARGPLPLDDVAAIGAQIAKALEAAHDQGIVHRDLKPANIKVRPDGTVKILDFGLAKAVADRESGTGNGSPLADSPTITTPAMTQAGTIMGTAAYMSPEQAKGRIVDRRTDIWAFGCVFYEMLTGRRAFAGDDVSDVLVAILRDEPDWSLLPAGTPAHLRTLITRCLQKDPNRRLPHIGSARLDLTEGEGPATAAAPSSAARRRPVEWAAAAVAGALMVAAIEWVRQPPRSEPVRPAPVRFQIAPPPGGRFPGGNGVPRFATSPDGESVVYQAVVDRNFGLWLRRLNATEGRVIPGTEGQDDRVTQQPFWAPDSRAIAYFNENTGQLKTVDLQSGGSLTLAEMPGNQYAGAWAADGTILFASTATGGIRRVSASGGLVTQLTTADAARGEQHLWPDVLPGGRLFLYLSTSSNRAGFAIYVGSLDGGAPKRLIETRDMARFAAPDRILFVRDDSLVAQRLDLERLTLTGAPSLVANSVLRTPAGRLAVSTSTTGVLVYAAGEPVQDNVEAVWMDRTGRVAGSLPLTTAPVGLRLSRDGRWLAFGRSGSGVAPDLWLFDTLREIPARLAAGAAAAVFSPDASRVAYRAIGAAGNFTMREQPVAGTAPAIELVSSGNEFLIPQDWSSDGRYLLYSAGEPARRGLFLLPSSGDRKPSRYAIPADTAEIYGADISDDGHWLAYATGRQGTAQVFVQRFPDPSAGRWAVSRPGAAWPRWRRDGRELFFRTDADELMAVPIKPAPRFEAGQPTRLFTLPSLNIGALMSTYDAAPDGERFIVLRPHSTNRPTPLTVAVNWDTEAAGASRGR